MSVAALETTVFAVIKAELVNANLKTQITVLEVALAAAIEAKRVADLSAPWQAQLALADSALITSNTVVSNAAGVMNSDAELSCKTTAVEASK
jgi:hypothetical protein